MRAAPSPVGELLRDWRKERRMSQLALALEAGVSPRHVSFVETGRSQPSREMLHHLAETLDVPLRERNALLTAAGFAPTFREADADLAAPELAPVRAALEAILRQQEPFPAVVMDRRWDVVRTNDAAARFFAYLLGGTDTRDAPDRGRPNVLRMMFDPRALRPRVANWESVAQTLLGRARREAVGGVIDAALRGVLDEVLACPGVPRSWASLAAQVPQIPVVPVTFERDGRTFRYFSTVTTLGTPQDVSLQELRVECFFPLDEATRAEAARLADRGSAGC